MIYDRKLDELMEEAILEEYIYYKKRNELFNQVVSSFANLIEVERNATLDELINSIKREATIKLMCSSKRVL